MESLNALSLLSLFTRVKQHNTPNKWQQSFWYRLVYNKLKKRKAGARQGRVIFVGAGCSDIELLTIKAVKALQVADVVLVDWLVNPEINELIPAHTLRIFVGKKCGQHVMKQDEICQLLADQAAMGKTVVRLKGGDPSIFGRLAEETEALSQNDIPFQIIPGITAASGCAAYAGIPLTHRNYAHSVKFVTAHLQKAEEECEWQLLAQEKGTLVFYMGLNRVNRIAEKLISNGMAKETAIAVIDQGTSDQQQVCKSTLQFIQTEQALQTFTGPALIIVGDVVNQQVTVNQQLHELASAAR